MVAMVAAKPLTIYDTEVVSPYIHPYATSSQYIARNYNTGYNGYYVADTPVVSSLPYNAAYTSYVL